jgi:hypothetical protein
MAPMALVTINLHGWPPPVLEIHALVAALPQREPDSADAPPNAYQHVNDLDLSFPFGRRRGIPDTVRAGQLARAALSSVYAGDFDITNVTIQ